MMLSFTGTTAMAVLLRYRLIVVTCLVAGHCSKQRACDVDYLRKQSVAKTQQHVDVVRINR